MVKAINTLIEKKENCGHSVLTECAKVLNVQLPVFSKTVKTADLYLLNAKFKKTFDEIYSLAIEYRNSLDLKADKIDRQAFIKDIKANSEILTRHTYEFDKKYRETATLENEAEISANEIEIAVIKMAIAKNNKTLQEQKRAYKVQMMEDYGLI